MRRRRGAAKRGVKSRPDGEKLARRPGGGVRKVSEANGGNSWAKAYDTWRTGIDGLDGRAEAWGRRRETTTTAGGSRWYRNWGREERCRQLEGAVDASLNLSSAPP